MNVFTCQFLLTANSFELGTFLCSNLVDWKRRLLLSKSWLRHVLLAISWNDYFISCVPLLCLPHRHSVTYPRTRANHRHVWSTPPSRSPIKTIKSVVYRSQKVKLKTSKNECKYSIVKFSFKNIPSTRGGRQTTDCSQTDPSVTNSAWESIFQLNVDFHFTTWILGFLNISEYLARYTERRKQSGKKPVLCKFGLLSTIIRGGEQSDQESVIVEKIALVHEHNWALITSTSAREVARASARRPCHPARAVFFSIFLVSLPPLPSTVNSFS